MLSLRADLSHAFSSFDLAARSAVLVAVSGGSDSTALLLALKAFVERHAAGTRLVAATVDHGLRPESVGEARAVGELARRAGIDHLILEWRGDKPSTGLPAAAREARYRLLAEAAGRVGTDLIATGHTADDQAETVLMRRARGEGRGLSGMAPATLLDGRFWIVRPLLAQRRAALRDDLRAAGFTWIEDPTNKDGTYERARLRARLGEPEIGEALALSAQAAAARQALGTAAARLIDAHAASPLPGLVTLGVGLLRHPDRAAALHALRVLLAVVGGTQQLAEAARVEALAARLLGPAPQRATLSRCVVDSRRSGLHLYREWRDIPSLSLGSADREAIWDGRYRLLCHRGPAGLTVTGLGHGRGADAVPPQDVPASIAARVRAAGPAVVAALGLPPEPLTPDVCARLGIGLAPIVAPWAHVLPGFDLDLARAAARLVGAACLPASPWRGHNVTGA